MNNLGCIFCEEKIIANSIADNKTAYAIYDKYQVTHMHTLIVSKRHVNSYFELSCEEKKDIDSLVMAMRKDIVNKDLSVTGFNIGINCGVSAGQTIMHLHVHLIPRRDGDCNDPRGGVRGVIVDKMKY